MILSALRARTRFFIDEPTQKNWLDSDLNIAINIAQADVAKEISHIYEDYFIKTADLNASGTPPGTIPGQELYSLPADFIKFKRVERSDLGEALSPIDINEKPLYGTASAPLVSMAGVGNGICYYIIGNSVGFTPTPADYIPIRLYYNYRLVDLVNDSDTSEIPQDYHDMLALRAAIDAFIKDESDTSALERRYNGLFSQLQRTLRNRQTQEPRRVRRTDNGNYASSLGI